MSLQKKRREGRGEREGDARFVWLLFGPRTGSMMTEKTGGGEKKKKGKKERR